MSATHNHGFSYLLVNPVVAWVKVHGHDGESIMEERRTGCACGPLS